VKQKYGPSFQQGISPRSFLVGIVIALCALMPRPLLAEESKTERKVLIISDKANEPFINRIRAEILALGLNVLLRPAVGPLEADAREQEAIAAIRVLPSGKGVEVWMADVTSGRSLLRQLIVDEKPEGPDQTLIALQTAELLRTSLFPKTEQAPLSKPPVLVVPDKPEEKPSPAGEFGARAGFGVLHGLGDKDLALQIWLSLHTVWRNRYGLALNLSGPVRRGSLSGPEGSAAVGAFLVGGEFFLRFEEPASRLFLTTGLGAAWLRLGSQGHPEPPLVAGSPTAMTGLGYARIDGGWHPWDMLRLGLATMFGAAVTPVEIRFAGNDAGKWGWPLLAAFIYTEVDWK
jgi:hypothetical protein